MVSVTVTVTVCTVRLLSIDGRFFVFVAGSPVSSSRSNTPRKKT